MNVEKTGRRIPIGYGNSFHDDELDDAAETARHYERLEYGSPTGPQDV